MDIKLKDLLMYVVAIGASVLVVDTDTRSIMMDVDYFTRPYTFKKGDPERNWIVVGLAVKDSKLFIWVKCWD